MARAEKTLDGMRNNPRDWRIESLESVADAYGINVRKPGGSHIIFEHPSVPEAVSVPAKRPIKPVYVKQFVKLIDRVRGNDDET
jgi:predicted RNA binding protein YcfA (HicA-like mRNA interferase family)